MFTVEEKRDAVVTYLGLAFGQKTAWLAQQPFTASQLRRWRSEYVRGDLDRGLTPRQGGSMDHIRSDQMRRLEEQLAAQERRHATEVARLRTEADGLRQANESLGKAIGLLQHWHAHEPVTPPTTPPERSSQPRTTSSET